MPAFSGTATIRYGSPFEAAPVRADEPCCRRATESSSTPGTRLTVAPGRVLTLLSARTSITVTLAAFSALVSRPPMPSMSTATQFAVTAATSTSSLSSWL